jgi:diketogulonate reductase-like aldo/keto reductase
MPVSRRGFLQLLGGTAALAALPPVQARTQVSKPIPSSGELLPVIGMGSWITFDVGNLPGARAQRRRVLEAFFAGGGRLVDASPMYGRAEEVIGESLARLGRPPQLFSATKVWTPGRWLGVKQMEASQRLWGVARFDLMQVHNLLDWEVHLETLQEWKATGRIRYLGVTTSHGRRHAELEQIMRTRPLDFVQLTYNLRDREAEQRLLPLAQERGIAVIANRPFGGGELFRAVRGRPLPPWAAEVGCANWAQYFLRFIVSHPAVTCAIPATSQVAHMEENVGAGRSVLPGAGERARMLRHFSTV